MTGTTSEAARRIVRTARGYTPQTWLWFDASGELLANTEPEDGKPRPNERAYLVTGGATVETEEDVQRLLDATAAVVALRPDALPVDLWTLVDEVNVIWGCEDEDEVERTPAAELLEQWALEDGAVEPISRATWFEGLTDLEREAHELDERIKREAAKHGVEFPPSMRMLLAEWKQVQAQIATERAQACATP